MIFRNFATMIKKQGTILIVDDNRNILTTVRMLLEPIFDGIITIAPSACLMDRLWRRRAISFSVSVMG
jgi:response regulator RpfG family c-di-GMP phosphodiesterase